MKTTISKLEAKVAATEDAKQAKQVRHCRSVVLLVLTAQGSAEHIPLLHNMHRYYLTTPGVFMLGVPLSYMLVAFGM